MHTGGPSYCEKHDPARVSRLGWICPKCGAGVAPHMDKCPCSGFGTLPFPLPCVPWIPDSSGTITDDSNYQIITTTGTSPNVRYEVTGWSVRQ